MPFLSMIPPSWSAVDKSRAATSPSLSETVDADDSGGGNVDASGMGDLEDAANTAVGVKTGSVRPLKEAFASIPFGFWEAPPRFTELRVDDRNAPRRRGVDGYIAMD